MHLFKDIQSWLTSSNTADYSIGINLFTQVSNNTHLIRNLSSKENIRNREKLAYELDKYIQTIPNAEKQAQIQENKVSVPEVHGKFQRSSILEDSSKPLPHIDQKKLYNPVIESDIGNSQHIDYDISIILEKLKKERNELYAKRRHYHNKLKTVLNKKKCFELAGKITPIQAKLDKYHRQISKIEKTGIIPRELTGRVIDGATQRRITSLNSYLSKYRKKIRLATSEAEKLKHQSKLDSYQVEYDNLKY